MNNISFINDIRIEVVHLWNKKRYINEQWKGIRFQKVFSRDDIKFCLAEFEYRYYAIDVDRRRICCCGGYCSFKNHEKFVALSKRKNTFPTTNQRNYLSSVSFIFSPGFLIKTQTFVVKVTFTSIVKFHCTYCFHRAILCTPSCYNRDCIPDVGPGRWWVLSHVYKLYRGTVPGVTFIFKNVILENWPIRVGDNDATLQREGTVKIKENTVWWYFRKLRKLSKIWHLCTVH